MRDFAYLQEAIGYVMEKIRSGRKMTKLRLADFSGLQDSCIRTIAKGGRNPSIGTIYAICEALGVSVIEFLEKGENRRRELLRGGEDKKQEAGCLAGVAGVILRSGAMVLRGSNINS